MRVKGQVLGGVDEGGWANTKMESRRVAEEREWDQLRLRDVRSDRATYARDYAHQVIVAISPYLLQCKCVEQLLPHLVRRSVVASKVRSIILSQSDTEAASSLERLLNGRSREPGVEASMVEGVYLALLDCYEESGSVWCHGMAVSGIQPVDLAVIHQRVSSTNLPEGDAAMLTEKLGLSNYGPIVDLKKIIQIAFSTRVSFHKLVSALLLTRHTGRYLSLLLPYCHSNPPWVYEVLQTLGQNWVTLAVYLGYSEVEIGAIARAGGEDPHHQIQMFMRAWWMPDCGTENETVGLLNQLSCEVLTILHRPVSVHSKRWDSGLALLYACLDNDWEKAEALIKRSHLGARTKDGRTPLMLACIKGKEKMVNLLIDHGADVQAMDARGEACLNYTETLRNRVILERILREYQKLEISVDVESLDTGCSPLSTACKCGAVASAELLLKYGANPNGCKNGRHRPLVEASAQGHVGLVNMLLRYRADIDATGKNEYTALLQACTSNHWGVAQVLMNEGADVNKCVASDCTSPLFLAVTANEYRIASELIKKGASVNAVRFQPGAVEGTVEVTPLSQAAGKGLDDMVTLLLNNGANINYLCSDTLPAIAFTILGDRIETFHLLLKSPNLVKTLAGLTPVIVTSVRTEKFYYTEKLLELFGGPQVAMIQAQNDRMDILVENIMMYMQAVHHPELAEVGSMQQELMAPASRQMRLGLGHQEKINSVLTDFSRICMSAILYSHDVKVNLESVIEGADATGNEAVADFLRQTLSGSMTDQELRQNFLLGDRSPLRFLIENKILTMEIFVIEVFKFRPDDSHIFYNDLVWTFQHMNGGADLPSNVDSMLKQLFSGRFTPRTSPQADTQSRTETHQRIREPVQPQYQRHASEPSLDARTQMEKTIKANLKETPLPEHKTTDDGKGNPTLPEEKSTGVRKAVENVDNNTRPSQSHDNPPIGAQLSLGVSTADTTRTRMMVNFSGVNHKLGGVAAYCPTWVAAVQESSPQVSRAPVTPAVSQTSTNPVVAPLSHSPTETPPNSTGTESNASNSPPTSATSSLTPDAEKELRLPNTVVNTTGKVLGQGTYGDVLEVQYKGKIFAAKKYRFMSNDSKRSMLGAFGREHEILALIRHPNIVPYYGICKLPPPDNSTVMVMERLEMNVTTYLECNKLIELDRKIKILFDVINGLKHLHSQNPAIIHRDLTAGNVLLNSKGVAKISDFGNSRMVDLNATPELLTSNPGTLDYMPPEALEGGEYDDRLDIFSYGHLAIHIIIQNRPHPLLRPTYPVGGRLLPRTEVERRLRYLTRVKTILSGDEHPLYLIIVQCLQDEPSLRPNCEVIISNDVFRCVQ